jgi:tight adherence protein B
MGLLLGGILGLGLLLCLAAVTGPPPRWTPPRSTRPTLAQRAGVPALGSLRLAGLCLGVGLVTALVVLVATGVAAIAVAFGAIAGVAPRAWLASRANRRAAQRRELWPDVVDNLSSAVRAGLSLPESLSALAETGPADLRAAFGEFARSHRVTGSFSASLDALSVALHDPVAERVIAALRLAREVGGTDLGLLMRSLSSFLREDARVRAEVEARQSWTVAAARLAVAAPWVVLLLLASQSSTVAAYNRPSGAAVLAVGAGVSWLAYRVMRRLGRLPEAVGG